VRVKRRLKKDEHTVCIRLFLSDFGDKIVVCDINDVNLNSLAKYMVDITVNIMQHTVSMFLYFSMIGKYDYIYNNVDNYESIIMKTGYCNIVLTVLLT
jgi:hypothetical protein